MRSYRIYLLRHGKIDERFEGRYIGKTDVDLSLQGITELRNLSKNYEYPTIGKLYSSPLKRCLQTCGILYPNMQINTVSDISEYDFGDYEDKSITELKDNEYFLNWCEGKNDGSKANLENSSLFSNRIRQGFDTIIKDMMKNKISSSAVITHGGVIMSILAMCGLPRMNPTNWNTENGHGYSILINAALWGNTATFEICDKLPYNKNEEFQMKNFEFLDVEDLKNQAKNERN